MKKSSLTTAVVAGIAGAAGLVSVSNAVNINPDGLGQVLIYPYYTVNSGNATLISVVNTTDEVKAVKVRFLEGRNSKEVLDFNLYLSPYDVWTGAVVGDAEGTSPLTAGPGKLFTSDTSCTVPAIPAAGASFVNYEYHRTNSADTAFDLGPSQLSRTREGHIEMIEMGRVDINNALGAAAVHEDGVPANCARLVQAWGSGGTWRNAPSTAISYPNGGLFGGAEIVDVANGTNVSYNADALEGFYALTSGNLHSAPETISPSLEDARTTATTADAIVFDSGTLAQFTYDFADYDAFGLKAVSSVFMHDAIYNEFVVGGGFASEWVITFPTKGRHLAQAYAAGLGNDDREPFVSSFTASGACESIDIAFWDREEYEEQVEYGFSPQPPGEAGTQLCYEAQVVTMSQDGVGDVVVGGAQSSVLGSYYARNVDVSNLPLDPAGQFSGWMRITFNGAESAVVDSDDVTLYGLPVTGFWAAQVTQSGGGSALANFSIVHKHRASRDYLAP